MQRMHGQIRLAFSPNSTGGGRQDRPFGDGSTFDLTAVADQNIFDNSVMSALSHRGSGDSRPSTGQGVPFYFHYDDDVRDSDPAVGEAELARMRGAEAEQCFTDRFWGLDREFWEQRRAVRGMYLEDVASWRLREAAKISKQQEAWEDQDRQGRQRQAEALGWHAQKTREAYLNYFYQAPSSEAIASYVWPSRPKMHYDEVVTREDYGIPGHPAPHAAHRTVLPGQQGQFSGVGRGAAAASRQLFHMGGTPTKHAILHDRTGPFLATIAKRQLLQQQSSSMHSLGPGRLRTRGLALSSSGQSPSPESDLDSALGLTRSSSSKVVLEPISDPAQMSQSSSFIRKKKKEKPKRIKSGQLLKPLNNQASKSNLGPRPLSGTLTDSMKSPNMEAAPQRVRPHTSESLYTGRPESTFQHSEQPNTEPPEQDANQPFEASEGLESDPLVNPISYEDEGPFAEPDQCFSRNGMKGRKDRKPPFVPLEELQKAIILPDDEEEILTRAFEIIDTQGRGYITEDELLFGVQENTHARAELKNTILWAIIKKRNWRLFGVMFAPLGNADLQAFIDFSYKVKVQRKVHSKFIRPASQEEPLRHGLVPWTFKVGDMVEFLLLQGANWYCGRILAVHSHGTYDVECVSRSQMIQRQDSFLDGDSYHTNNALDFSSMSMLEIQDVENQEEQILSAFFQDHADGHGFLSTDKILEVMDHNKNVLKKIPSFFAMYIYPKLLNALISIPYSSPEGLSELEFVQTCLGITEIARMNNLLKV